MSQSPTVYVDDEVNLTIERWFKDAVSLANSAVKDHGFVSLALSGGSTPKRLYRFMASDDAQALWPWSHTRLFWGDERDVWPTHPESNYRMTCDTLLGALKTPALDVFRWPVELPPQDALAYYRRALALLPATQNVPELDICLLGVGADGHTASLFPASPQAQVHNDWVASGPGPSGHRYTLTFPVLMAARTVTFLATGREKAPIVQTLLTSDASRILPAGRVTWDAHDVRWFLDDEAKEGLDHV